MNHQRRQVLKGAGAAGAVGVAMAAGLLGLALRGQAGKAGDGDVEACSDQGDARMKGDPGAGVVEPALRTGDLCHPLSRNTPGRPK